MTTGGILHLQEDFFGADEAITNFDFKTERWVATLIVSAADRWSALAKRDGVIEKIAKRFCVKRVDTSPLAFENLPS
jgi:pyrrolysine biosynthesis protein PylC